MRSTIKKLVPFIGIAFFAYLMIDIGPMNIADSLLSANPFYVSITLVILVPHLLLQTSKWMCILRRQDIRVPFTDLFRIYLIGVFYSILTPGKIGTLIRIVYLRDKAGKGTGECASSVVIDRIMDLLSMFVLALLGVAFLLNYLSGTLIFAVVVFFALFVAAIILIMKESLGRRMFSIVYNVAVPAKYKKRAKRASASFYDKLPPARQLSVPFIMTIMSWTLVYTAMYFAALSLNLDIPFLIFITTAPIATIIGLIPVTISGWGTREASLIALFSPFTSSAGAIVAMSFISFITLSLFPALAGAFLALKGSVKGR